MSRITIVDNPRVTLWYHPEEKIVHHCIHGFIYGCEFQEFLLAGTDLLKKHGAIKWLSNDQSHVFLRKEDTDWGDAHWFPQAMAAGWKHWAIVQPKGALAQMDMDELVKHYSQAGIHAKFFINEDEAWVWLVDQPG